MVILKLNNTTTKHLNQNRMTWIDNIFLGVFISLTISVGVIVLTLCYLEWENYKNKKNK
jgi:hypothetical protein